MVACLLCKGIVYVNNRLVLVIILVACLWDGCRIKLFSFIVMLILIEGLAEIKKCKVPIAQCRNVKPYQNILPNYQQKRSSRGGRFACRRLRDGLIFAPITRQASRDRTFRKSQPSLAQPTLGNCAAAWASCFVRYSQLPPNIGKRGIVLSGKAIKPTNYS